MLLVLQTTWNYAVIRLHCPVSRISSSRAAVQCHTHVALEILPFLFLREKNEVAQLFMNRILNFLQCKKVKV